MHVFTNGAESATVFAPMWNVELKQRADDGVLRGADKGEELYTEVVRGLQNQAPGTPVALDFKDIRAVTVPFIETSIRQLLSGWLSGYHEERPLLIHGTDEDVRETLAAALRNWNLVALSLDDQRRPQLLGGDPLLEQTVEQARDLGPEFSVADLSERLNLSAPATNNRLRALLRSGAVARTLVVPPGGGKEYVYRFPVAAE